MNSNPEQYPDITKIINLLRSSRLQVVNLGLGLFADTLQEQGIPVMHVDWQPPAGGDQELNSILSDLNDLY